MIEINPERDIQSKSPKIIIAGMSNKLEAFYDRKGEYCAAKSTTLLLDECGQLISLIGFINSKILSFFITHFYHSLKMSGEYINIGTDIISNLPIPRNHDDDDLIRNVNKLISTLESNPLNDITEIEEKINKIIYELYGLSSEEISIVEKF